MKLNELKPAHGAVREGYRKGQGPGSGNGKTAGRGSKGYHSRSGSKHRPGFEGGQMPLHRRVPKRGFTNIFRKEYSIVNLETLERLFAAGTEIKIEDAKKHSLLRNGAAGLKVLADGEITKALVIHAHKVSARAKEKIEAAGGRVELIAPPVPYTRTRS